MLDACSSRYRLRGNKRRFFVHLVAIDVHGSGPGPRVVAPVFVGQWRSLLDLRSARIIISKLQSHDLLNHSDGRAHVSPNFTPSATHGYRLQELGLHNLNTGMICRYMYIYVVKEELEPIVHMESSC